MLKALAPPPDTQASKAGSASLAHRSGASRVRAMRRTASARSSFEPRARSRGGGVSTSQTHEAELRRLRRELAKSKKSEKLLMAEVATLRKHSSWNQRRRASSSCSSSSSSVPGAESFGDASNQQVGLPSCQGSVRPGRPESQSPPSAD